MCTRACEAVSCEGICEAACEGGWERHAWRRADSTKGGCREHEGRVQRARREHAVCPLPIVKTDMIMYQCCAHVREELWDALGGMLKACICLMLWKVSCGPYQVLSCNSTVVKNTRTYHAG